MSATRVLIVDSHPLMADSLSASLAQEDAFVTMACHKYTEVPDCIERFHPQIIVINVALESVQYGLEACAAIMQLPGDYVMVMIAPRSIVEAGTLSLDALEAGADGVLIAEDMDLAKLVGALEDMKAGRSLLDAKQIRDALLRRAAGVPSGEDRAALGDLTPRELEIANLITAGCSTTEIADRLSISERTVQNHISNILTKLNVRTRSEAVARLYMWRHAQPPAGADVASN